MSLPEDRRPTGWRAQEIECVVLGRAIRETRARREISQETLGFRANLHRNYVGAIERGEINPTFRVLRKVSSGLTLELSDLFALYEIRLKERAR